MTKREFNKIVIPRDIESIPEFTCFSDLEENELVREMCIYILREAEKEANKYRYGEVAIAYNLVKQSQATLNGSHHHIELNESLNPAAKYFNDIIRDSDFSTVIIVHNHPNNMEFSFQDLRLFYGNDSIHSIIAVGNTSNVYIIIDENVDVPARRRLYVHMVRKRAEIMRNNPGIKNYQVDNLLSDEIRSILEDPSEMLLNYGFRLIHKKRKR